MRRGARGCARRRGAVRWSTRCVAQVVDQAEEGGARRAAPARIRDTSRTTTATEWQTTRSSRRAPRTSAPGTTKWCCARAGGLLARERLHGDPAATATASGSACSARSTTCSRRPATRTRTSRCSSPRASCTRRRSTSRASRRSARSSRTAAARSSRSRSSSARRPRRSSTDVRQVGAELPRPAAAHQPVGERRALGDAHAPVPAHHGVPLAGRAHRARHARRGRGGSAPDAGRVPRLHGGVDGDAGRHRAEDRLGDGSPARCARTRAKR